MTDSKKLNERVQVPFRFSFVHGLIGGALATIILYIATIFLGLPYPPQLIFQLLVSPVPGSVESVLVETFGELAKYGTFIFAAAIYTFFYGTISTFVGLLYNTKRMSHLQLVAVATAIPAILGLGIQAIMTSSVIGVGSISFWVEASAIMVVANLVFARTTIGQMQTAFQLKTPMPESSRRLPISSRRRFLKRVIIAGVAIAGVGIAWWIVGSLFSGEPAFPAGEPIPVNIPSTPADLTDLPTVFRDPKLSDLVNSEVTDNRIFYRIDTDPIPPQVNFDQWSLKISGTVDTPLTIDRAALLALPVSNEYATLECVSNTINPPSALISNAKWTGVSLAALLSKTGTKSASKFVVFRCADGYSVGIPLERAMNPAALLAYKMNDETLPVEHGYPLRAIVPGIYGMMNAKWLTEIEVTDQVYLGYWQQRGWSNDAKIKTTSLIYYPQSGAQVSGPIPIAGIAFAGDRGISKVEVSTDGGSTWNEAVTKKPRSPYSWVLWAYQWKPNSLGNHMIVVRAVDGTGDIQDSATRQPFPEGATGFHSVQITVAML